MRFAFSPRPRKALWLLEDCDGMDHLPFEVGGRRKVQAVSLRGSLRLLYAPVDRCSESAVHREVELCKLDCN
ncbi:hypothetical protein THAOC_13170 [Thalassiosira oceanica]|uniref:Uncharacterized protein n=1 Tax=Thalassiosira oceanica TaxID=159749 RepID=K0SY34_THAOC|nr:hypothetical protein THAOC_13170 [Thalassiosira oceanica]|eukprot:EJK65926.1 hypothetical protein THAOC_13170 [Thalassiosira oceanica]